MPQKHENAKRHQEKLLLLTAEHPDKNFVKPGAFAIQWQER